MLRLCASLRFTPGEVQHQFVEDALEEIEVPVAGIGVCILARAIHLEDAPGRPSVDGRIHIAESPLVGGKLAIGMHIPFPRHEQELRLGEFGVDEGEGDGVECEIPGSVPRILPFVWH